VVVRRIQVLIVSAFAFVVLCADSVKAQEEAFLGTVLRTSAASYVLQMDDGKMLYCEWHSGYEDWSVGERVALSTESGEGFMFSEAHRSQVDVSFYNPAED
jgi:hypothetical protein